MLAPVLHVRTVESQSSHLPQVPKLGGGTAWARMSAQGHLSNLCAKLHTTTQHNHCAQLTGLRKMYDSYSNKPYDLARDAQPLSSFSFHICKMGLTIAPAWVLGMKWRLKWRKDALYLAQTLGSVLAKRQQVSLLWSSILLMLIFITSIVRNS